MNALTIRLTHKIMAIGVVGLVGLLAFGAIYQVGGWSQDESSVTAANARAISDQHKHFGGDAGSTADREGFPNTPGSVVFEAPLRVVGSGRPGPRSAQDFRAVQWLP